MDGNVQYQVEALTTPEAGTMLVSLLSPNRSVIMMGCTWEERERRDREVGRKEVEEGKMGRMEESGGERVVTSICLRTMRG